MERLFLYRFMSQHRYGVVSSIGGEGNPQSALVGIATSPDLEIIFDTVKSSRKYSNLIARPACSFVVGWSGEQTVQFEGCLLYTSSRNTHCREARTAGQIPEAWMHHD